MKKLNVDFLNILSFTLLVTCNYLFYNDYPVCSLEGLSFILLLACFLTAPLILLDKLRQTWLFYSLLILLFLDLTVGFVDHVTLQSKFHLPQNQIFDLISASFPPFAWSKSILACGSKAVPDFLNRSFILISTDAFFLLPIGLACYALRKKIAKIILMGWIAMLATTALQYLIAPRPLVRIDIHNDQTSRALDKPNILILILDEHIGIEGIPMVSELARNLKEKLIDDYTKNGFNVYGGAYSNYYRTLYSIPSILSYALLDENTGAIPDSYKVLQNLRDQGYALNIYQSSDLDFRKPLQGRYRRCLEYDKNSIGFLKNAPLPFHEKLRVIFASFIDAHQCILLQKAYWVLSEKYDWLPWGHVEPLAADQVLERIQRDMEFERSGTVFLAHLLIPHSPYLYDSEGRIKSIKDWDHRLITQRDPDRIIWKQKSSRYLEQVACTHKMLAALFDKMKAMNLFEPSTIVIFGDHGSRIYSEMLYGDQNNVEWGIDQSSTRDLVDLFSTFLAIKKGGGRDLTASGRGTYLPDKTPLTQEIGDFFLSPVDGPKSKEGFHKIYLRSKKTRTNTLYPYPMVDFSEGNG